MMMTRTSQMMEKDCPIGNGVVTKRNKINPNKRQRAKRRQNMKTETEGNETCEIDECYSYSVVGLRGLLEVDFRGGS